MRPVAELAGWTEGGGAGRHACRLRQREDRSGTPSVVSGPHRTGAEQEGAVPQGTAPSFFMSGVTLWVECWYSSIQPSNRTPPDLRYPPLTSARAPARSALPLGSAW